MICLSSIQVALVSCPFRFGLGFQSVHCSTNMDIRRGTADFQVKGSAITTNKEVQ